MAKGGKGATLTVDFSKVTEGGGANKRIKAGTYPAVFKKFEIKDSQSGNSMVVVTWEITDGKYEGTTLIDRLVITDKALFRMYNMLKAMGKNPEKKKMKVTPQKWVGEEVGIDVEDDEYENNSGDTKLTSRVGGYVPLDEVPKEGGDDKKSKKKDKGKKSKKSKKGDNDTIDEVDLDEV